MLTQLHVQNFAILSDISLKLSPGFNVFSGETGAGKSIVIEALGFVLGARGDGTLIKDGTEKCVVVLRSLQTLCPLPYGSSTN